MVYPSADVVRARQPQRSELTMANENLDGSWYKPVKLGPFTVVAFERPDRQNAVYVKYSSPEKRGRDRRVKVRLPGDWCVRNSKGAIDPRREREILIEVARFAAPLLNGHLPAERVAEDRGLTLSGAFDLVMCTDRGKYPMKSRRWEEVNRARKRLERILGKNTPMSDIQREDIVRIWRTLATEYTRADAKSTRCGVRQTEVTVDALFSAANWLRSSGKIGATDCLLIPEWRSMMKREWQQKTGELVQPKTPRHSEEEMLGLFANLYSDEVDPRFSLAFDLGGEQRIGQVLRATRTQLSLPPIDKSVPRPTTGEEVRKAVGKLGSLRFDGAGKKKTAPILFTPDLRDAVDRALAGYLSEFEDAFQAGKISDYKLFPAERLRSGKAKFVFGGQALGRGGALKMFRVLERVSDVESVPGRGWYGVRRIAIDMAEDVNKDERVLNASSAHDHSSTRRGYQEPERSKILIEAAMMKAEVRGRLPQ